MTIVFLICCFAATPPAEASMLALQDGTILVGEIQAEEPFTIQTRKMNDYQNNDLDMPEGSKRSWRTYIVCGLITIVFLPFLKDMMSDTFRYWLYHGGAEKLRLVTPAADGQDWGSGEDSAPPPLKKVKIPDLPEVPLQVLEYSSQKNASYPALAVVDGDPETLWISGSSPGAQNLRLRVAAENAAALTNLQICTPPANSQYAEMAVRSVTLFSSQELSESPALDIIGTYELPPGDGCYLCKFPQPRPLRALILQVNEPAGSSAAALAEIVAYGQGEGA